MKNKIKRIGENNSEYNIQILETMNNVLLLLVIITFIMAFITTFSPNKNYDTFKENVETVMELNKPLVYKCKVSKNKVKVYFNDYLWNDLGTLEKVSKKQSIEAAIQTIGENTGYIQNDKHISVVFYNSNGLAY